MHSPPLPLRKTSPCILIVGLSRDACRLQELVKPLLRLFSDPVEKCREISVETVEEFVEYACARAGTQAGTQAGVLAGTRHSREPCAHPRARPHRSSENSVEFFPSIIPVIVSRVGTEPVQAHACMRTLAGSLAVSVYSGHGEGHTF